MSWFFEHNFKMVTVDPDVVFVHAVSWIRLGMADEIVVVVLETSLSSV
jgi:hypothetical protein